MALQNRNRLRQLAVSAFGVACFVTLIAYAADGQFSGKWKGELKPAAPQARSGAPTGGPVSGPGAGTTGGTTTAAAAPAPAPAPAPTGGGGRTGGRGGFGGGFGGAAAQKVSLNLKQSKDDKISGNIMYGDQQADDVRDGRATGNTLTFKAGKAPLIYEYLGELKGEDLVLTRNSSDGKGRPQEIVLSKK